MIPVVADPSVPEGFLALRKPGETFPSVVRTPNGKIFRTKVEPGVPKIEGNKIVFNWTVSTEEI